MKGFGKQKTVNSENMKNPATNDHPINALSHERWSPRAFSENPVPARFIASLLEAARWAPSAMNEQSWRFMLGTQGDDTWDKLFSCLSGWNPDWAGKAPLLILVIGKERYEKNNKSNDFYAYDCGQAAAHMTLEATNLGLFSHQMGGFDKAGAVDLFSIPEGFKPLSVIAIGYYGDPGLLSDELKEREEAPRERKELKELVFSGAFGQPSNIL